MRAFSHFTTIVLVLTFLSGCTNVVKKEDPYGLQRRKVEEYFMSSGVLRYFLPEIPFWANFSEAAQCRRQESIKYLDLNLVRGSLFLSYEEAIQLQLMMNTMLIDLKKKEHIEHIPFKEEEALFFKASDRIQAGIRTFRVPNFNKIHVIWVDAFLEKTQQLKQVMSSSKMDNGHPVFLSLCLTRRELEDWMASKGFNNKNIRLLSYEMLSPYDLNGELDTTFHIYINEIFGSDKKVKLFIPKTKSQPHVLEGEFQVIKF